MRTWYALSGAKHRAADGRSGRYPQVTFLCRIVQDALPTTERRAGVIVLLIALGTLSLGLRGDIAQATTDRLPVSRLDRFGDPLPAGVVARMGSGRMRHLGRCERQAFSPDGRLLASCGGQWLMLWDPATGKLRHRVAIDGGWASACVFAADGLRVAAVALPKRTVIVHLIDPNTGQVRRMTRMPELAAVANLAFAPGGRQLAYICDKSIRLYDPATGRELLRIPTRGFWTRTLAFSPDGHTLAVADFTDTVHLYDTITGKSSGKWKQTGDKIARVAWSPDGRFLAAVPLNDDQKIQFVGIWDVATGKEVYRLPSIRRSVFGVAFSLDGHYVAFTSLSSEMALWDLTTGKEFRRVPGDGEAIAFSPDGKTVAVDLDEVLCLYDVATGKRRPGSGDPYLCHIRGLRFSPDGTRLLATAAGPVGWNVQTGQEVRTLYRPAATTWRESALSPDGSAIAELDEDGSLRLRDGRNGRQLHRLTGPGNYCWGMAFSPNGRSVYATGIGRPVREWDVASGKQKRSFDAPGKTALWLAVSPDGRWLATAPLRRGTAADRDVTLWNLTTGQPQANFTMQWGSPACLAFSANSRYLAAAGAGMQGLGEIKVWDIETRKLWRTLNKHRCPVYSVAFSPDGRMLASGDEQGTLLLWELVSGRVRQRFVGHEDSIRSLAFSPDGRLLAAASADAPVFVWAVADELGQGGPLAPAALDHAWKTLAAPDAAAAWQAVKDMAAAPQQSVPFLKQHLRPAVAAKATEIKRLIAQLDSPKFAVRQRATADLARWLDVAEPLLREAETRRLSPEAHRRLKQLLQEIDPPTGDRLRELRAVEVLERAATPPARALLAKLARGVPEAGVTQAARAALRRLARSKAANP